MIDVGQTVGNYNITAKLGEGGMGTVFLAEHPVIGSKVALKAIHPEYARSPEVVSRFVNEARAVNQIGHDHIIDIHDFGNTPAGDFYFIMEFLNGEMLSDQRGRQVVFSPARALNIVAQIADALAASHERGVIHRDLKPDNIFLITRDANPDFVKVLDFGLAKLTGASGAVPAYTTDAGIVMGTPYYMSPGAVRGASGARPPERRLLPGRHPVRDADRPGPLRRRGIWRGDDEAHLVAAALRPEIRSGSSDRARGDPQPGAGQGSRRALSNDGGVSRGAAQHRERPLAAPGARRGSTIPPGLCRSSHAHLHRRPRRSAFNSTWERSAEAIDVRPRRSRRGIALSWGAAAALALVAIANGGVRGQATQLLARTAAPKRPATVRVNFSSDPAGATVSRSDGAVLGVTPLSAEIPYSDKPVDYRLPEGRVQPEGLVLRPQPSVARLRPPGAD